MKYLSSLILLVSFFLFGCSPKTRPALGVPIQKSSVINHQSLLAHLKYLASDELQGRATGTIGGDKARTYLFTALTEMGYQVELDTFQVDLSSGDQHTAYNVIAHLPNSHNPNTFVICAHYDHLGIRKYGGKVDSIFNGADDNASGVALVLELAKTMRAENPQHSMIFLFTDAEEMGLKGANHFVRTYTNIDQVILNINFDMISRSADERLNICGLRYNKELKDLFARPILASSTFTLTKRYDGANKWEQDWTGASDHFPFHKRGIPFLYFGVEDHPDYHQASDEYEKIDQVFYKKVADYIHHAIRVLDTTLDTSK